MLQHNDYVVENIMINERRQLKKAIYYIVLLLRMLNVCKFWETVKRFPGTGERGGIGSDFNTFWVSFSKKKVLELYYDDSCKPLWIY